MYQKLQFTFKSIQLSCNVLIDRVINNESNKNINATKHTFRGNRVLN